MAQAYQFCVKQSTSLRLKLQRTAESSCSGCARPSRRRKLNRVSGNGFQCGRYDSPVTIQDFLLENLDFVKLWRARVDKNWKMMADEIAAVKRGRMGGTFLHARVLECHGCFLAVLDLLAEDWRSSGANSSVGVPDSPVYHDITAFVLQLWGPDHESAYRQFPVAEPNVTWVMHTPSGPTLLAAFEWTQAMGSAFLGVKFKVSKAQPPAGQHKLLGVSLCLEHDRAVVECTEERRPGTFIAPTSKASPPTALAPTKAALTAEQMRHEALLELVISQDADMATLFPPQVTVPMLGSEAGVTSNQLATQGTSSSSASAMPVVMATSARTDNDATSTTGIAPANLAAQDDVQAVSPVTLRQLQELGTVEQPTGGDIPRPGLLRCETTGEWHFLNPYGGVTALVYGGTTPPEAASTGSTGAGSGPAPSTPPTVKKRPLPLPLHLRARGGAYNQSNLTIHICRWQISSSPPQLQEIHQGDPPPTGRQQNRSDESNEWVCGLRTQGGYTHQPCTDHVKSHLHTGTHLIMIHP
ncbi:unnamed protein product [Symbiodinium natans]|uniref:Uncharacterized protein n=1 Tax=Symbiodinium natans TaxID=878477 RepID=A0A812NZS0_9DINO|nr:unnamed protein product [Symbiodinium natans]